MPAGEILISEEQIHQRVQELGREISAAIPPGDLHVVITLKGAFFFAVDLIRSLDREVTIGFITASSYGSETESSRKVQLHEEHLGDLVGRHVLLVEDIIDTGHTLLAITEALRRHQPASIHTVAFLDKTPRREVDINADHVGFPIENIFIVGYGLDSDQEYRTLPDIRAFLS